MANPFASIVGQRRAQSLLGRRTKQWVSLGPWPRGLMDADAYLGLEHNDLEKVPEGALALCSNLDVDSHGHLSERRGFQEMQLTNAAGNWHPQLLGTAEVSGVVYGIVGANAAGSSNIYLIDPGFIGGGATLKTTTTTIVGSVVYANTLWLVSSTAGSSKSQALAGLTGAWALTAQANIPAGHRVLMVKDRMFVINMTTSRVYYSKATDPTTWTAPDGGFFDVHPGDGSNINAVVFDNSNLYIFKDTGIWLFSFVTDPAIDGYLRQISTDRFLDARHVNGTIYCLNYQGLFRLVGTNAQKISTNVRMSNIRTNSGIVVVGNLILISTINNLYVYNMDNGLWCTYIINISGYIGIVPAWNPLLTQYRDLAIVTGGFFRTLILGDVLTNFCSIVLVNTYKSRGTDNDLFTLDKPLFNMGTMNGHLVVPQYTFVTRRFKFAESMFFKIFGPMLDYSYQRGPLALSPANATVKIHRSPVATDALVTPAALNSFNNDLKIKGVGTTFSMSNTSTPTGAGQAYYYPNFSSVKGINPDVTSHNVKTLSTFAVFNIDSVTDAANVASSTESYPSIDIRNLLVLASGPSATVNDTEAVG